MFGTDPLPCLNFPQRSIVHDVAEVAGLVAHSFGEEDVDRHIVIWKKEQQPCEAELNCLRAGNKWDPVAFERTRAAEEVERKEDEERAKKRKREKFVPKTNYQVG